ncbi:MAG: hypothetical protein AAFX00_10640, partial [Pseudomonadota bacterium]
GEFVAYRQTDTPLPSVGHSVLNGDRLVIVPVFSPHSAELVAPYLSSAVAPVRCVAISAAAASHLGLPAATASAPTAGAIIARIAEHLDKSDSP